MRILTVLVGSVALGLATIALFGRPSGVEAGTAIRMEVTDLAVAADLILEARVLSSVALENEGRIETEYVLEVDRTFAGEDRGLRAIRVPGGVLEDGRGMMLAGMPSMRTGEEVLLFLGREHRGGLRMPVGLSQGKFELVRQPDGAKRLVRNTAGVTLVRRDGVRVESEGRVVMDYADVVSRIEAARALRRDR